MPTGSVPDDPRFEQLRQQAIERYWREPDEVADSTADVVDHFLVLACLRYGGDDTPDRWERAGRLLADHPAIARTSIYAAAATAATDAVRDLLADDPQLAKRQGGPFGWEPLLYLAYARHDPAVTEAATLDTARILLDHGADPNAGYLWHGLTTPFTAVTGALGGGEGDQPAHPQGLALAAMLLDAGADPNDGQALYNRQFGTDDLHLKLLLAHGLGRGDGGPWRARLSHAVASPSQLLRVQLWWAIVHDMRDRVQLLVEHGVDFRTTYAAPDGRPSWSRSADGRTPTEVAALNGCPEMVDWFVARGAIRPPPEGVDGLIAAALSGDGRAAERLRAHAEAARTERPALIVWAAARGKAVAIPLLVDLGFDVNALGRTDVPMEQAWETALHAAALQGDVNLARLLLGLGADPTLKDARFDATPLGWARFFGQQSMIELLEPLED
jgi:ankyrin repeat protein